MLYLTYAVLGGFGVRARLHRSYRNPREMVAGFLAPCDISVRFEENLAATFSLAPESLRRREAASWKGKTLPEEIALVKIRLPQTI